MHGLGNPKGDAPEAVGEGHAVASRCLVLSLSALSAIELLRLTLLKQAGILDNLHKSRICLWIVQ